MINIVFLGLISFFADISSEMVYPVIPIYLTAALLMIFFFDKKGKTSKAE